MKFSKLKFSILAIAFSSIFSIQDLLAENDPPIPMGSGGFDDTTVVGGAIDDYLPLLFLVAMLLGVWFINKINRQAYSD